ncbi:MAG: FecR domain-containing protein [Cyclobacteriaceae bacterium]
MGDQYSDIDRLIGLYLSQRASVHEKEALERWLQASPANREVFEQIKSVWLSAADTPLSSEAKQVRERIWKAGTESVQNTKPTVHRVLDLVYLGKVAAIFILFLLGAGLFSYWVQENPALILPPPVALIEVNNPSGQRSFHTLADGTEVWLNAESSLKYPEKFSDTLRFIQLDGEAFFAVAKDRQRPFIVEAAGIQTQALGTAFNIHSYPEDDTVQIALLEGKVRIQSNEQAQTAILSPGEVLLAARDHTDFHRKPFNYENTFGWKEGILIFDGADFNSFRTAIERWYGVEVTVTGNPPADWHLRARYQQEDLRHVLRDVSFNKHLRFSLEDDQVLLTF